MEPGQKNDYSGIGEVFHTRRLPEPCTPAGYAALIDSYELRVPLPNRLAAISTHHRKSEGERWLLLTPRHKPKATLTGHLTFALKYEGVNLAVLNRLFDCVGPAPIEQMVRNIPTGGYVRRIWFLYEWLTGQTLDIPATKARTYVPVIDPDQQYAGKLKNIQRQRVKDNLPGTPRFCPLVFKTRKLDNFIALDLAKKAREFVQALPRDLVTRAAAFLLLKDSKSSFEIEGESPPHQRVYGWGQAIAEAGKNPLDLEELLRLQLLVLPDTRFIQPGLRQQEGFVGEHDRVSNLPLPDHISARPEDLTSLVGGMIEFDRDFAVDLDPVIAAAILAFGFVYTHPLEDGNGRLHRYLIHHVLARRDYTPPGLVFPVSSAILDSIDEYRRVLELYSKPLLKFIEWEPTDDNNVRVLNDTADYYRFFDATPHAEFLYQCTQRTVEEDLPEEAGFLCNFDDFQKKLKQILDLPSQQADLLFKFLHQNSGKLSNRARSREFAALTDEEARKIEALYAAAFATE